MQVWNPDQYEKFKEQRSQPFYDLMAMVRGRNQAQALDLGCGTGELSAKLFERYQIQNGLGIDSSAEMLAKAKAFENSHVHFEKQDIASYSPAQKMDLIFSNAALQWVPRHETLFPKIFSWLKPGGELAIQMPCNFDHPSHRIAGEVGFEMFPDLFPLQNVHFQLSLETYAEMMFAHGFQDQHCRIQIYGHPMTSGRDVVQWTKGTLLTRYQSNLSESDFAKFLAKYETRLVQAIGEGPYYYAFKRMLLWGVKS